MQEPPSGDQHRLRQSKAVFVRALVERGRRGVREIRYHDSKPGSKMEIPVQWSHDPQTPLASIVRCFSDRILLPLLPSAGDPAGPLYRRSDGRRERPKCRANRAVQGLLSRRQWPRGIVCEYPCPGIHISPLARYGTMVGEDASGHYRGAHGAGSVFAGYRIIHREHRSSLRFLPCHILLAYQFFAHWLPRDPGAFLFVLGNVFPAESIPWKQPTESHPTRRRGNRKVLSIRGGRRRVLRPWILHLHRLPYHAASLADSDPLLP